ncbi:uncharacterized protein LOC131938968 [Physella acuta]|uniref:uncharacterized protein LOC131938968 n=1 Tax=Physella acuta TaxID=109671 RepID=UPI0027DB11FB|nr:uncharacterized protein LOC131938968 [Physella acuta]
MGSPVVVASPRKSPSTGRRTNKPLVEKKRRARINGCLGQLKSLILSAMQTEGAQVSRLEKADILEMTVKYLRHIQHQQAPEQPEVVAKFSAGYSECATEVIRYIDAVKCVTPDVRSRLENHLVERLRGSVVQGNTNPSSKPESVLPVEIKTETPVPSHVSGSNPSQAVHDSRHYQAAVDLANIAVKATVNQTTVPRPNSLSTIAQSSQAVAVCPELSPKSQFQQAVSASRLGLKVYSENFSGPRLSRSQSISPSNLEAEGSRLTDNHEDRKRHNSSEPALHPDIHTPQPVYQHHHENDKNNNSKVIYCDINKENDYLWTVQRPLHIHIPDSPHTPTTPSPPYPQQHIYHHDNSASAMDDAPPTILYGYHDHQISTSPCLKQEPHYMNERFNQEIAYSYIYKHQESELGHQQQAYSLREMHVHDSSHRHHVTHSALPPTPSPPTLTREEPCHAPSQHRDPHHELSARYANGGQPCYHQDPHAPNDSGHVGIRSNYSDQHTGHSNSQYRGHCDYLPLQPNQHRPQPYKHGNQSPVISLAPAGQISPRTVHNGPATAQASVHSRQNGDPLSPPTLKKRLLFGHESGREWTGSSYAQGRQDTKNVPSSDYPHNENEIACADWREARRDMRSDFYTSEWRHTRSDESLWRPW